MSFHPRFQVGHLGREDAAEASLPLLSLSFDLFSDLLADLLEEDQLFCKIFGNVFALFDHPRGPRAAQALDPGQHADYIIALEEHLSGEQLGNDAAEAPNIYLFGILAA